MKKTLLERGSLLALTLLTTACMTAPPNASSNVPRAPAAASNASSDDPYLWLEDVGGDRSLAWVRERNAASQAVLQAQPQYAPIKSAMLSVLDSKERIPRISRIGAQVYNLWQDADHKRGLWRRTTIEDYARPQPRWETVLDLDALGAAEKENWVWGGARMPGSELHPLAWCRCRAAARTAKVVREFDLVTRQFVAGGFELPEAKSSLEWADADTIYVGTDFGPGSMTDSGYARVIKVLEARHAAVAGARGVRGRAAGRLGQCDRRPHAGLRAHRLHPRAGFLHRPAVPAAARRRPARDRQARAT